MNREQYPGTYALARVTGFTDDPVYRLVAKIEREEERIYVAHRHGPEQLQSLLNQWVIVRFRDPRKNLPSSIDELTAITANYITSRTDYIALGELIPSDRVALLGILPDEAMIDIESKSME